MENNNRTINYPLLLFVLFQLVFIIFAVVSIKNMIKDDRINPDDISRQPSISIENLTSKIPDLKSSSVVSIEHELLRIVKNNLTDVNFSNIKATIREGSAHANFFETENISEINFIVDLPDLKQTYRIFHEYSSDSKNEYLDPNGSIIALCVTESSEIIYEDFACVDLYSQKTRNLIVQKYLAFYDSDYFYAEVVGSNYDKINIGLFRREETDGKTYIEEAKAMVRSLGNSPDLFTYTIVQPEGPTPHSSS